MKKLHFKKVPGGPYRIRFYAGEFYVPVEEGLIKELKKQANGSPEEFLKIIKAKLGYNIYLKNAIEEILNGSPAPATQAKTLMTEIQSL
jgi:hypothetical protein